jgi:hypothetical protein
MTNIDTRDRLFGLVCDQQDERKQNLPKTKWYSSSKTFILLDYLSY